MSQYPKKTYAGMQHAFPMLDETDVLSLVKAGLTTPKLVKAASDDTLEALGISKTKIKKLKPKS